VSAEPSRRLTIGLLGLILLAGTAMRFVGVGWDGGNHLNPDERFLTLVNADISAPDGPAGYFDTGRSALNPANHGDDVVYGTAPVFAVKGVSAWLHDGAETGAQPARAVVGTLDRLGVPLLDDEGNPTFDAGYESLYVGRAVSALVDVFTIALVFELGRAVRGRWVGLAGALAYACCATAIQYAHFYVTDPMLTLATAAALVAAVHVAKGRGRAVLALGAAAAGWAGASKVSGLSVLLVVAGGAAIARAPAIVAAWREPDDPGARPPVRAWRSASPLAADALLAAGAAFLAFRVLQPYAFDGLVRLDPRWTETLRRLSELQDGADFPPNVQWANRVPVLEPLLGYLRYGLGIPMTLLASTGLAALRRRTTWRVEPVLALLAGWLLVVGALFLPRFVATWRYLLPAAPVVAVFAGIGLVGLVRRRGAWRVGGVVLAVAAVLWGVAFTNGVYGRPNTRVAAADWVAAQVPDGSVLSFEEWDDGLPLGPGATDRGLTTEKLAPFALTTPDDARALVAALDDIDYVVETSDRITGAVPQVPARYGTLLRYYDALRDGSLGFEHVASFRSGPSLFGIDADDSGSEESFRVYDHPPVDIWRKTDGFSVERALAVIQPDRALADESVPLKQAGANGLLLDRDADRAATGPTFDQVFGDRLPLPALWWWLWWTVLAAAALPWSTRLLRALPDRGWGLSKVVGPMAVLVPLWFAVAVGAVSFGRTSIGTATVLGVLAGGLAWWRHRDDPDRDVVAFARSHWRSIACVEALALAGFLAVLALRAANPDLWFHPTGGEKPMAAAYLTAIARTSTFPPPDPWFSGGAMNYYYGTWYTIAAPARLLGISPDVALNLAVATVASLLLASAWSVGAALARLGRSAARPRAALTGLFAAVLVLVVGNLASIQQQLERIGDALGGREVAAFDWWGVSRLHAGSTDINEFPGWSVLFADPHPHLLWAPLLIAVIGLETAYVATRAAGDRRAALGLAGGLGAALAWCRVSHTWDLPTLALLSVGAVVVGTLLDPTAGAQRWERWKRGALHLGVIGLTTLVVSHPYAAKGQVFDSGFTGSPVHTPFGSFLLQYGIAFGVVTVALVTRTIQLRRHLGLPPVLRSRAGRSGVLAMAVGGGLLAALAGGPVTVLCAGLVACSLALAAHELRARRLGSGLAWALVAAGAGLAALPELVVIVNDIGRQNTVFKFGMTSWSLLALGAAGTAATAVPGARFRRSTMAVIALLVIPGLVFWPSAVGPRLDARFQPLAATLDGRAWLDHGPVVVEANEVPPIDVTQDDDLIAWMRAHVPGGATIVEAAGPSYTWVGRVSVATGLPTVIGWAFHETQQRRGYANEVDERTAAVKRLYADPEPVQALRTLAAYRPDYVVVGTVEHALGTPEAIDALGGLPGIEVVWQHGDEVLYEVDHPAVDRALAAIDAERIAAGEFAPDDAGS